MAMVEGDYKSWNWIYTSFSLSPLYVEARGNESERNRENIFAKHRAYCLCLKHCKLYHWRRNTTKNRKKERKRKRVSEKKEPKLEWDRVKNKSLYIRDFRSFEIVLMPFLCDCCLCVVCHTFVLYCFIRYRANLTDNEINLLRLSMMLYAYLNIIYVSVAFWWLE